jgi:hypothetical protein
MRTKRSATGTLDSGKSFAYLLKPIISTAEDFSISTALQSLKNAFQNNSEVLIFVSIVSFKIQLAASGSVAVLAQTTPHRRLLLAIGLPLGVVAFISLTGNNAHSRLLSVVAPPVHFQASFEQERP